MVGGSVGGGWVNTAKIKVVPFTTSALRCVCMYVCVCGCICVSTDSPVRPSRCWQDPLHLPTPPTKPCFFVWMSETVCVYVCVCVCVCQQARSAQCGSDVKVIDSRAVTRAIESSCGKRGTLQPHSFQPWGGRGRQIQRGRQTEDRI